MLNEQINELKKISDEFKTSLKNDADFYNKIVSGVEDQIKCLESIRDKSKDPDIRSLAAIAVASDCLKMAVWTSYRITINILTRFSMLSEITIITMVNEIEQIKQQSSLPKSEQDLKKIKEIEDELIKLKKEFQKYSPTLKEFKQALDRTKKIFRDNL
jgi:DNA anti-recombination protein RmuC